jgi:hypothetical protein
MLCHYCDTIVSYANKIITYSSGSNLFLNDNLVMTYTKLKETICHGLMWNYNDIDVEII